jgi:alpha-mannosidase
LYPKLIITTTADAFRKFEARYGKQLPVYRGDYTPYWEDGAGSSARETAQNRASAERLVQAETVWSLRQPGPFPADDFYTAWRNILLYSEHTWGAHNSISQPDIPFVKDQWRIKQAFAVDADKQSRTLFESSFDGGALAEGLDVFNTTSWPRTDLVILPAGMSAPGDRVVDEQNRVTASQRLASGELAFLAENVPPLGGRRYRVLAGKAQGGDSVVTAEGMMLRHPLFRLRLDEQTGGIASLYHYLLKAELVDPNAKTGLNDYFYLPGADVKGVQRNGPVRVSVRDRGPLVASLLVESDAPGCKSLAREIRVVAGLDRIELVNTVDKLAVRAKEGLHFGYGFNVPKGTVRVDVGWAVVRPNVDQIPAACKNWFSAQRWVDVSNSRYGVTLMPLDAPLIEIGGLTANLIGSQTDHRVWITELPPSQTIYSWFMNNHWHTNYRADQDGPTVFRYVLRPHGAYSPLETARAGVAATQPLIAARARGVAPAASRFTLSSDAVLVTAFKPADDGQGSIVRLYGAAGKTVKTSLRWSDPAPKSTWLSDTSEKPLKPVHGPITVPAWGIVTLRLEK